MMFGLIELSALRRPPNRGASGILAFSGHSGTFKGLIEAIDGQLEHLRGSALDLRNLADFMARAPLEFGGFGSRLRP